MQQMLPLLGGKSIQHFFLQGYRIHSPFFINAAPGIRQPYDVPTRVVSILFPANPSPCLQSIYQVSYIIRIACCKPGQIFLREFSCPTFIQPSQNRELSGCQISVPKAVAEGFVQREPNLSQQDGKTSICISVSLFRHSSPIPAKLAKSQTCKVLQSQECAPLAFAERGAVG